MPEDDAINRKIERIAIGFGFFFFSASVCMYVFFSIPAQKFENKIFLIESGETLKQVSKNLKKEGIIRFASLFDEILRIKGKEKEIKAGKYVFKKPDNILNVVRVIISGPKVEFVKITIPEGWTKEQMGEYFEKNNFFSFKKEDWLLAVSSSEGYLFPDTYFIDKDSRPEQIARIMRQNFESKITPEMYSEIQKDKKTLGDIVIMASLIEREAFDSLEEKKIIAGVLWKRLENNMPLQVDAAVSYIVAKPSLKLTEADLAVDSPFNTYKYRGLPPAPIGNPGLEAIIAAIYPQSSPFWYYLHDKQGKIRYAKTFEEHKKNKAKYLR